MLLSGDRDQVLDGGCYGMAAVNWKGEEHELAQYLAVVAAAA
jgi:hypothetical protein